MCLEVAFKTFQFMHQYFIRKVIVFGYVIIIKQLADIMHIIVIMMVLHDKVSHRKIPQLDPHGIVEADGKLLQLFDIAEHYIVFILNMLQKILLERIKDIFQQQQLGVLLMELKRCLLDMVLDHRQHPLGIMVVGLLQVIAHFGWRHTLQPRKACVVPAFLQLQQSILHIVRADIFYTAYISKRFTQVIECINTAPMQHRGIRVIFFQQLV